MARKLIALLVQAAAAPIINENDKAAEAITPGHLVTFNGAGNLIKHAVAGGRAQRAFALEREELGATIDDAYAIDDVVKVGTFPRGAIVNALVAAAAAAIVKGDYVESAGDGTVRKATTLTKLTRAAGHVGVANGELQDVTNAFAEAALENNFEEVAAKLDALLDGGHAGILGRATEAVDNSGGAEAVRLRIEVL